jgi:twinfilin-like protein
MAIWRFTAERTHVSTPTTRMTTLAISLSPEVKEAAGKEARFIKIGVEEEALVLKETKECKDTLEDDWEMLAALLDDQEPSYILALIAPTTETTSASWLLITYIPDNAQIRKKMLYASTRASLVKELGGGNVVTDSIQANDKQDCTFEAYKAHKQQKESPAKALTEGEQVAAQMKHEELHTRVAAGTQTKSHAASLALDMTSEAQDAIESFTNFIALKVDSEKIDVLQTDSVSDFSSLQKVIPDGAPAFCFYKYNDDVIFVYVCPPSAKIREKMLYSASKGPLLKLAEEHGLKPVSKYEVDDMSELEKDRIEQDLTKPDTASLAPKLAFKKPTAPGRRPTPSNS